MADLPAGPARDTYVDRYGRRQESGLKIERNPAMGDASEVGRLREFVRRFVASAGYDDEDLLDALVVLWDDAEALLDDREDHDG